MIYSNEVFLGHTDVEMNEGDTMDTPHVVEQVNQAYGNQAWDRIDIVRIS
jgi:hypothetical protein